MEIDALTIVVIVILLIVAGVFIGTQYGSFSKPTTGNAIAPSSMPAQVGGGGCGI